MSLTIGKTKEMTKDQCLKALGSNLDQEALNIIANASKKPGMSNKIKSYKHLL